jgi:hypothetical protein
LPHWFDDLKNKEKLMSKNELNGKCLCGAVSFRATPAKAQVGVCHCAMCRKWSSGPYFAIMCGDAVEFTGMENATIFRSSKWAERGFCKTCGTNLFWRLADGSEYGVAAGMVSDQAGLTMAREVFVDEKPDWYAFANKTQKMTGPEVIAMFASDDAG